MFVYTFSPTFRYARICGVHDSVYTVATRENSSIAFGTVVVLLRPYRLSLVGRGSASVGELGAPNKNLISRFSQILSKLELSDLTQIMFSTCLFMIWSVC